MHIILGALGTIVTILWLLHRLAEMGVSLGGLNPWLWRRRRKWRAQHVANPIYKVDRPLDATALVLTAVAKADGDISAQDKAMLLGIFENEFRLSARDAASLLTASTHLFGRGDEMRDNLKGVLAPSLDAFSDEQVASVKALMSKVGGADATALQRELIERVTEVFAATEKPAGKWA